jgi:hypothetical protein
VRWVTARHDFELMRKVGEGSGIFTPGEL